jgi:hypothetical protein
LNLYRAFGEGIVTKTANAYFVSIVADDIIVTAAACDTIIAIISPDDIITG